MGSLRLTFRVPGAREDELVGELWALGTDGVHVRSTGGEGECGDRGEVVLDAYFEQEAVMGTEGLRAAGERCDAILVEAAEVEAQDWLASYRARSQPMSIGPFVIDPREPEPALRALERQVSIPRRSGEDGGAGCPSHPLRIPARNAFGTGSHESTGLLLEELGELELDGRTVLDVGTGSGILVLAALCRGPSAALGFDPDVGSVLTARDNARLNELAPRLFGGRIDAVAGCFDVVLVNILPHRWLDDAMTVVGTVRPGGLLFVSGLLETEREHVLATSALAEFELESSRTLGEWAALKLIGP